MNSGTVELTERQTDIVDWYLGTPAAEHWFDSDHEGGQDFSHLPEPKLSDKEFTFPKDQEWLEDFEYRIREHLPEMAAEYGESGQQVNGFKRASKNLVEKIEPKIRR